MTFSRRLVLPAALFLVWTLGVWIAMAQFFTGPSFWLAVFLLVVLGFTVLAVYLTLSGALRPPAVPSAESASSPLAGGAEEVPIGELLAEAESRLAQSHLKTSFQDLPFYLLAGPAGAGKTSAFLASGLSPELLAGQVYRETTVLPTGWCNFWFAGGAVFAEAGGRFVSDDLGQWRNLLRHLVARHAAPWLGKRGPGLRGLIWCCDITPFLGMPDPTRIDAMARRVQERLQAAGEILGSSYPVYVIFTKADQIPHFGDFIRRFSEEEDSQVLGCTLPAATLPSSGEVYADAQTKRLLEPFNQLSASLAERRLTLLARESNAPQKPGVYEFPREMKRLRDSLIHFLVDAFRPNPLQPGALLRGFYFSGVREVPFSAGALASVPASAGPSRQHTSEATMLFKESPWQTATVTEAPAETTVRRWAFVTRLFHQIILPDPLSRAAAVQNVHHDLRSRLLMAAAVCAATLLTVGGAVSWWGNWRMLARLDAAAVRQVSSPAPGSLPALPDLRSMEELRQQLLTLTAHQRYGAPMSLRWGLYSGAALLPQTSDAYFQRFARFFHADTRNNLVAGLARLGATPDNAVPYGSAYDTLKAYRMITSRQCSPDARYLTPVFARTWLGQRPLEGESLALAQRQIRFYAEELTRRNPYRPDERPELVKRGRDYLASFGGLERIYRGILDDAGRPPRPAARLAELAPNYREVLASPGEVPAAFTRQGWAVVEKAIHEPGRQSLGESCVVGDSSAWNAAPAPGPEVAASLTAMYTRAYLQAWKDYLHQTAVLPFGSTAQAARHLEVLADNRSPLLAALYLATDHTHFGPAAKVFQPTREIVPASSRERWIEDANRPYMNALGELQKAMARLATDRPQNPNLALHEQARHAVESGIDAVRGAAQRFNITEAEGVDAEVKRLLESPFKTSLRFIITDPTRPGRDKAGAAARAFCQRLSALERKFPFNPQSDAEVSAEEFAAVFAPPNGALFQLQQQLGRAIVRQGKNWVTMPDADLKITPEFLEFLNRLSALSEAFFPDGASQMKLRYALRPLPGPSMEISLEIDGDRAVNKSGDSKARFFVWPGPPGAQQVLIRVKAGANIPFASYEGIWGVFRMIGDADPRPAGSRVIELSKVRRGHGRAEAVLDANDRPMQVRLEITEFPAGVDVFERSFFRLRCPVRIVD